MTDQACADWTARVPFFLGREEDHLVPASNAIQDSGMQVRQAEARALAAETTSWAAAQAVA